MSSSGTFPLKSYDWVGGTLECRWWINDRSDNRSDVTVELWGHTSGFRTYGSGYFTFRIGAAGDGNWTGSVDVSGSWKKLGSRAVTLDHDAAGSLASIDIGVLAGEVYNTSFNSIAYSSVNLEYHAGTDYVVAPYAPQNIKVRAGTVATTSFGVEYTRNTYDGVDQDEVQWSLRSDFSTVAWTHNPGGGGNGSIGYSNPSGIFQLTPGTTYYVRARSHTSAGWGPYSVTISQVTLPAVPPGLTVASSPSGAQATLTFSPPGGVTGVDHYTYEQRVTGTAPVTSKDSPTTIATEAGLTPGGSYDWRASAWIGTYQSPWTGWTTLIQAKPNTNPGDYFDGNTPDTIDISFGWTGAVDGSISTAVASGVEGWNVWMGGPLKAVLYRVTAGRFGPSAARVQIVADSSSIGQLSSGQSEQAGYRTEVTVGGTYVGSIHVRPNRAQSMAAEMVFYNAAGNALSAVRSAATNVSAGTWTRLIVTGAIAPAGAESAVIRAADGELPGWSNWHGGDAIDLDGAMITLSEPFPYFDRDTPTDSTFFYQWTDEPNASTSTRTPLEAVDPSLFSLPGAPQIGARALLDPNCLPPAPPRPPSIPSDCITEVGVWRRTMQAIPVASVPDYLDAVPTFEIVTVSLEASQVRIRVLPNPDNLPLASFDATTGWISEQIISYIPKDTVLTIDGVHQRVQASVAGGPPIAADHLLYGSNGTPATWPVLSCGIPYVITADLPVEIDQGDSRLHTSLTTRY